MLFKDIDSKTKEISQLKNLLKLSQNPKQQALIQTDLARLENGYKAEKDNAYYLDFGFKNTPNNINTIAKNSPLSNPFRRMNSPKISNPSRNLLN